MRSTTTKVTACLGVFALGLSGCANEGTETEGNDAQGAGGEEEVELRFAWWGSDTRHEYTQEIIDAYEEEHPHITINGEFGAWQEYWDRIATQSAARDTPDIVQMDLMYITEYLDSGILLEIEEVDTSGFSDELLETGTRDGALYGMPVGSTAPALVANSGVFEESGVEMPDDETWTWQDLEATAAAVSANSDYYGMSRAWAHGGSGTAGFEIWLRQHNGENFYNENGELTWDPEDATAYFEHLGTMRESGAIPSASEISEDRAAPPEETNIATGQAALDPWWDTNLVALASEENPLGLELLKMPSAEGGAGQAEMYYKASMFYSVFAGSDHPEEAQAFVDYLVNHEEAGMLQLTERGIPGNENIRELIRGELNEVEMAVIEYSESVEADITAAPPIPPEGFGAVHPIMVRYEEEFLFDRLDATEAAERMYDEVLDALE